MEMEQLSSDGRSPAGASVAGDRVDAGAVSTAPGGGTPLPRLRREGERISVRSVGGVGLQIYLGGEGFRKSLQAMVSGQERNRHIPRLQRLPARPQLAEIVAATLREFGVSDSDIRRRRHIPARLAVAYLARHEAALTLPEFSPALGIQDWAASHLATSAEQLLRESRQFRRSIRSIQKALGETHKFTDLTPL